MLSRNDNQQTTTANSDSSDNAIIHRMIHRIAPFITCNHTLIRASAQTVLYSILKSTGCQNEVYSHIERYLETNLDCKKSIEKYAPFTLIFYNSAACDYNSIIRITTPFFLYTSLPFFEKMYDEAVTTV